MIPPGCMVLINRVLINRGPMDILEVMMYG